MDSIQELIFAKIIVYTILFSSQGIIFLMFLTQKRIEKNWSIKVPRFSHFGKVGPNHRRDFWNMPIYTILSLWKYHSTEAFITCFLVKLRFLSIRLKRFSLTRTHLKKFQKILLLLFETSMRSCFLRLNLIKSIFLILNAFNIHRTLKCKL